MDLSRELETQERRDRAKGEISFKDVIYYSRDLHQIFLSVPESTHAPICLCQIPKWKCKFQNEGNKIGSRGKKLFTISLADVMLKRDEKTARKEENIKRRMGTKCNE
jgi:hypothetical protein